MSNYEKYKKAFCEGLEIEDNALEDLEYESIPEWDSVGHMGLVAAIEDEFEIMLDTDDVIGLNSFKEGINILKKYDVIIEN